MLEQDLLGVYTCTLEPFEGGVNFFLWYDEIEPHHHWGIPF